MNVALVPARLRKRSAAIIAMGLLCVAQPATASPYGTVGREPFAAAVASVADYVAAFETNYRPDGYEAEALQVAAASLDAAQNALLPSLNLGQSLDWHAFAALSLELGAGIRLPLASSTAAAQLDLAHSDLAAQQAAGRRARREAYATLLIDLTNLAAVTWSLELIGETTALLSASDLPWLAPSGAAPTRASPRDRADTAAGDPEARSTLYVPPVQREAFTMYQRLLQADDWFLDQARSLEQRLVTTVGLPADQLGVPSLDAIEAWLPPKALTLADPAICRANSPLLEAERLRHAQHLAGDALLALPESSLALSANLAYRLEPWSVAGGPHAGGDRLSGEVTGAIALEARFLVPEQWPLGGNASLAIGPDGMHQHASLAWPPLPTPKPVAVDRDEELARALALVTEELAMRRSLIEEAADERARLRQQLYWLVTDAAADGGPGTVLLMVDELLMDPGPGLLAKHPEPARLALETAELRVQHAFARVSEVTARIRYLGGCGVL